MRGYDTGWFWALVAAIVALCAVVTPATAQTGLVGQPVSVCVARVQPGDTPAAMLRATDRFDCAMRQTDHGPGDYWVRSAPLAASGTTLLRTASLWQHRASLWTVYADGHVARRSYDGRALANTIQLGAIAEIDRKSVV